MSIQESIKTAAVTLAVIWVANQVPFTRSIVQKALTGI
jgi:hypothetical protein